MSAQAAQAAMQIFGSVLSGFSARAAVRARNIVGAANAAARNRVREGANEIAGAQGALARFMQSRNNASLLDAAGRRQEAAGRTLSRLRDAQGAASIQERLRASEDLGALAAASAFSGVSGSVVDMVAGALATREALREDMAARRTDAQAFEIGEVQRQELSNAVQSLDNRAILDNIDRTVDNYAAEPVQGSLLGDIVGSGANLGAIYDVGVKAFNSAQANAMPLSAQMTAPGSFDPTLAAREAAANAGAIGMDLFRNTRALIPDYLIPGGN